MHLLFYFQLLALVAIFIITLVNGMENMGHRRTIRTGRVHLDGNDLENVLKSYILGPRSSNVGIEKQYNEVKCLCVPHAVSRRTLSVDKQINEIDNKLKEIRMEGHGANADLIKELEDKMYELIMNGAGRRQIVGNANDVKCSCIKNLPGYQKRPHAARRMSDSVEQQIYEIYNKLYEILVQGSDVNDLEVKELENNLHALIMKAAGRRAWRRTDSVDPQIYEILNKLIDLHLEGDNANNAEIKKLEDVLRALVMNDAGRRNSKKGDYASDVQIIPFDVKEIAKKNLPRRDFK